jgi:transposase
MTDATGVLEAWALDVDEVRARMYGAPTPRERERWPALWLLARGWPAARVAAALGRDPHTIGAWVARFRRGGPAALALARSGGAPPPSTPPSGPP